MLERWINRIEMDGVAKNAGTALGCPPGTARALPEIRQTTDLFRKLRKLRPALVPLRRLFVCESEPQYDVFFPVWPSDLQPDRQSAFRKTTGHRDRRQAPDIERPRIPKQPQLRRP